MEQIVAHRRPACSGLSLDLVCVGASGTKPRRPRAALPVAVAHAVADALAALGPGPFAVRSSGVAGDLADASFAGLQEPELDVLTSTVVGRVADLGAWWPKTPAPR